MITIREYVAPKTLDEAYKYLTSKKYATLLGGCAYIRLGSKNIPLAIDLNKINLNYINESEDLFEIGAMTTFGDIERSEVLNKYFNSILSSSVKDIVGVQLRNLVTVGATVYSRYGFSDFITALLALDTKVKLYKQGIIPLEKFLETGSLEPDILESVLITKDNRKASFKSMRNSKGDYAILNLAVSKLNNEIRVSVGARPNRAILAHRTMEYLNKNSLSPDTIQNACIILSEEIVFGSNSRGSSEYRREISKVLLKRALMEVSSNED